MPFTTTLSRSGTSARIEFTGPFFAADPTKTFRQNVRGMLDGMAVEGEAAVKDDLARQAKHPTGRLAGSIHGRVQSLTGKRWAMTAVISSNLNQLIATERGQASGKWHGSYAGFIETGLRVNDRIRTGSRVKASARGLRLVGTWVDVKVGTPFRGYHMFRRVAQALNRSRAAAVADLTKGIAA